MSSLYLICPGNGTAGRHPMSTHGRESRFDKDWLSGAAVGYCDKIEETNTGKRRAIPKVSQVNNRMVINIKKENGRHSWLQKENSWNGERGWTGNDIRVKKYFLKNVQKTGNNVSICFLLNARVLSTRKICMTNCKRWYDCSPDSHVLRRHDRPTNTSKIQ